MRQTVLVGEGVGEGLALAVGDTLAVGEGEAGVSEGVGLEPPASGRRRFSVAAEPHPAASTTNNHERIIFVISPSTLFGARRRPAMEPPLGRRRASFLIL